MSERAEVAPTLTDQIEDLCARVLGAMPPSADADRVEAIRTRLRGPLRIAIAGGVKAGKSTLLNALVGERVAPTDAGECTKIVTWYQHGHAYDVTARLRGGGREQLTFRRANGAIEVNLGELAPEDVESLVVSWPSRRLEQLTLIDTPGLQSIDQQLSQRTIELLTDPDNERPSEVDGVIYLMRHRHRHDADFLESFIDRSVPFASPVNAVAVLSRADEVGSGRPAAMTSARAIAERMAIDKRLRVLVGAVAPVAGLIAETAQTLREEEAAALQLLAKLEVPEIQFLLLSADHFRDPEHSPLTHELREGLLERFGMFGLRFGVLEIRAGQVSTSAELSRKLLAESGLQELQRLLNRQFGARTKSLKARSALTALQAAATQLARDQPEAGRELSSAIEQLEAASHELAELRLAQLLLSDAINLSEDERRAAALVTNNRTWAGRVGADDGADSQEIGRRALLEIERWRLRGANPLTDRATGEACEILVRSFEAIYASVSG